jgi:heat shock protein HtpX
MSQEEVEAVLGHEVAHVANGDMVTLTLIQGVLRTFVVFLARIVGTMSTVRCSAGSRGGSGQLHHGLRV